MTDTLNMNVQYLKGVGQARAKMFAKLNIYTVGDLLMHFPRGYIDLKSSVPIIDSETGKNICIKAIISSRAVSFHTKTGKIITRAMATDGKGILQLIFFNNPYAADFLKEGEEFLFYGKMSINEHGGYEMTSPVYYKAENNEYLHPVYAQTEGLNSRAIAKAVKTAINMYGTLITDALPPEQLKKYRLMGYKEAIEEIHFPQDESTVLLARRRLIYEELLILQLGIHLSRGSTKETTLCVMSKDCSKEFESLLPFSLTGAQKRAISDCISDIKKASPMRRLIEGDVGSGKTAVAASVMYTAVKNGFQCALMAPTEVLAVQHKKTFDELFCNTGINICLLTGSMTAKQKSIAKQSIKDGQTNIVIGTHAVISDDVEYKNLGLAVTDEQHRFGVTQRSRLREKGSSPHIMVMSATPIPRTLSLIIYGDLDISVLDEKPAGRKPVKTFLINGDCRERMFGFMKKLMDEGKQCYIVCPRIEADEEDSSNKIAAEEYAKTLISGVFNGYPAALLHGKMKPKEKDLVMRSFASGEIKLLICTVVIEVGIDVSNAVIIAIENAECFGLSQLHQLRGRVGRGKDDSYCILISDAQNTEAQMRFNTMCQSSDGFKIAEEDLKLRGPGDFFGNRQSGLPILKIADLMTDTKILYAAKDEAENILQDDFDLSKPKNASLKAKTDKLFADIS